MARPKAAIISRRETLEVALKIIDAEGLDALSIRRLAEELDIKGASLYHHFRSKDDILAGVVGLALGNSRVALDYGKPWRDWFLSATLNYRRALQKHPGLLAIVLSRHPLRTGISFADAAASALVDQGVPESAVMPLIESVESLVLGEAVYRAAATETGYEALFVDGSHPMLASAHHAATVDQDRLFIACCKAIMETALKEATGSNRKGAVAAGGSHRSSEPA